MRGWSGSASGVSMSSQWSLLVWSSIVQYQLWGGLDESARCLQGMFVVLVQEVVII